MKDRIGSWSYRALAMAAILVVAIPVAYAKVGQKNLDRVLRTHTIDIPNYLDEATLSFSTTEQIGTQGLVARGTYHSTITTTVGAMPYPAKLNIFIHDAAEVTANAMTCSSLVVTGRDQFGRARRETSTALAEGTNAATSVLTTYAYEHVDSVTASGCNSTYVSGSDFLGVMVSSHIGLQRDLTSRDQFIAICQNGWDSDTAPSCTKGSALTASWFDFAYDTLDVDEVKDAAAINHDMTTGDAIWMRVRSPLNAP